MNGGQMEPEATVNMLHNKQIWGGRILSLHADKKGADGQMKKDLAAGNVSNEVQAPETVQEDENLQTVSKKPQRNRKRKNYGDDFEQINDNEDSTESEETESSTPSPALKETNGPGKKTKKVSHSSSGKENRKKQRASQEEKEKQLNISSQHDELVITQILGACSEPEVTIETPQRTAPPHPHFGGKQPKQHRPPKCISVLCREEKKELKQQLEEVQKELDETKKELSAVRAMQPSTTVINAEVKYGKIPRSVGVAKNWEEISDGVWCCPVKVKAAVKNSATRTALALALFALFYPKKELKGRRLHQLDNDIIDAITDFSLIAKLTKEPPVKKTKEGEELKPASPVSRSGIKQALRLKCNSVISLQKKKGKNTTADNTNAE